MVSALRHGVVLLPEHRWETARERWIRAEELGFDHAWTYDHLMWRWFRDRPWFATVPTLTAAAAVTSRITVGTLVATPSYRHPVPFAKELMTLDDIARGRLICGLGAGAGGLDDEALGQDPPTPAERADRFAEFVELTGLLLTRSTTSYRGQWFSCRDAAMRPGCVQRPRVPLALAATGPRGLRLAARHADIWITAGRPGWGEPLRYDRALDGLHRQTKALDAACDAIGRDPATLRRLVVTGAMITEVSASAESYTDACGRFAELGFTDVVSHWPRPDFPYQGRPEVLEEIAATVLRPGDRP
ncbi:LLM class flavin-dependent oxidoreductase [Streptomyces sp. NPDC000594]|uniref:LLM class flavin-dependent oxidoreductase n=1 Tax=Streptomyces sp. NPDC000594 TaxID=3154261 RepID=UPI003324E272